MFPYIGGKKHHSKWIDPFIPNNSKTYVEVFGGAMWLYWMSHKLPVETNVYNDLNRHLYNVFLCCATDPHRMEQSCLSLYPHIGDGEQFVEYRDQVFAVYDNLPTPDYDMAAKYMFLQTQIFTGGNGLTGKSKIYHNVNYKSKFKTFTEKFQQSQYLEKLKHITTENMNYKQLIEKYDSEDCFFYIDPPYYKLESYYTEDNFNKKNHLELLDMLKQTKSKWALSYYYFDELEQELPRDEYTWHEQVTYTNNGLQKNNSTRPQRIELLIMNYKEYK